MQVNDAHIVRLVERIGEHYRTNISNRFIRPALFQIPLEKQTWDLIETLTEKIEQYKYQGFHLDELYRQILAAARFVSIIRRDLAPTLRIRLSGSVSGSEKVLRDMAINTFDSNLQILADLISELYSCLLELDKGGAKGRRPLHMSMPELEEVSRLLAGS